MGYSLATIERILAQQELKFEHKPGKSQPTQRHEKRPEALSQNVIEKHFQKEGQTILDILLKPDPEFVEGINPSLLGEQRKRRRKHKRPHL